MTSRLPAGTVKSETTVWSGSGAFALMDMLPYHINGCRAGLSTSRMGLENCAAAGEAVNISKPHASVAAEVKPRNSVLITWLRRNPSGYFAEGSKKFLRAQASYS
jgi:hypothetical protein